MSDGYIDNKGRYIKPARDKEQLLIIALVNALAMLIADRVVDGLHFSGLLSLLLAAVLFTALNLSIKPVLQIAALPLTVLTCGIFALILNGFLLWLVVWLIPGCTLASFGSAVLGSIVISLANMLINWIISKF